MKLSDTQRELKLNQVFDAGHDACGHGAGQESNPYPPGSDEYDVWDAGFEQAKYEQCRSEQVAAKYDHTDLIAIIVTTLVVLALGSVLYRLFEYLWG